MPGAFLRLIKTAVYEETRTKQTLQIGGSFKMSPFAQSMRQTQILILEIINVFLWLKFSPSLTLNKIERFETAS